MITAVKTCQFSQNPWNPKATILTLQSQPKKGFFFIDTLQMSFKATKSVLQSKRNDCIKRPQVTNKEIGEQSTGLFELCPVQLKELKGEIVLNY